MTLVRIGTRASPLARVQTDGIAVALRGLYPGLVVEVCPINTTGDRSQHTDAPSADWGTGVFVKELEAALLRGDIDLAVHSLKDLPAELPEQLAIVAVPLRADPRDVLVSPSGCSLETLPEAALVGSTSARRVAFLRAARPDLRFSSIRGNVDTRCRKMFAGEYDAIVLARAGLARLGLDVSYSLIDPRVLPPAPGQGALGLEARADDARLRTLLLPLHDASTAAAVEAERTLMSALDGGCRLPLAALATPDPDGGLDLIAAVAAPDGSHILRASGRGLQQSPAEVARRVADRLRQAGALELLSRSPVFGATL